MARIEYDMFGKPYISGVEQDVADWEQHQQYVEDMATIGNNFNDDMANAVKSSVAGAAATVVGVGALSYGMVKNRAFRYKMQAFLHFPMAFVASFLFILYAIMVISPEAEASDINFVAALIGALIGGIIWTGLYIHFRTKKKLRALRNR